MKPFLFLIALFACLNCYSQKLELSLSVPQPRLGEQFDVSFNIDTISKGVFRLDTNKFKINSYGSSGTGLQCSVNLTAVKAGENELGPFDFNFNGKTYKTNKIKFTIADSLPTVAQGLWIRKLPVDDTTVYIMLDQIQHVGTVVTRKDENTITSAPAADADESDTKLALDVDNARVEEWGSSSTTAPDFTNGKKGNRSSYKCYKVTILDKKKPLVLSRSVFKNLPVYYQFKDIIVN